MTHDHSAPDKPLVERLRQHARIDGFVACGEGATRIEELERALEDACTLLSGWIETKCSPRYRAEHRADLAKKRALLAKDAHA